LSTRSRATRVAAFRRCPCGKRTGRSRESERSPFFGDGGPGLTITIMEPGRTGLSAVHKRLAPESFPPRRALFYPPTKKPWGKGAGFAETRRNYPPSPHGQLERTDRQKSSRRKRGAPLGPKTRQNIKGTLALSSMSTEFLRRPARFGWWQLTSLPARRGTPSSGCHLYSRT